MTMRRKQIPHQQLPAEMWITKEETEPLPAMMGLAFRTFLSRHDLSILDVALEAGVRLLTIWNIEHNNPISHRHAERVCAGLYRLTGVHYRGHITLRVDNARSGVKEH